MEDLQKFFKTYYAPNNLTLVFAGDLVPERVFELARRYFESFRARRRPLEVRTEEPEQLASVSSSSAARHKPRCCSSPTRRLPPRTCGPGSQSAAVDSRRWRFIAPAPDVG